MKIAYFDCQFGAAGDMLNAALLAAGVDAQKWKSELGKIDLDGQKFNVVVDDVVRCNIVAKKLDVLDDKGVKYDSRYQQSVEPDQHEHHHHRDEEHHHSHDEHKHQHERHHHGETHHDRRLPDILRMIDKSGLTSGARSLASRIFSRLAEAESRVHGVRPDEIHFHEVGAVDSIVDIVGFSIGYDLLGIQKSFGSAIAIGAGRVQTEHGLFPIPGPATLYLLEASGAPIAESNIGFECLTPTGAAILCEVISEWGKQPAISKIDSIGYGAGTKDPPLWPNVCRVVVGEASDTASDTASGAKPSDRFSTETLAVVEANLDDFNPQALAFAMERLFEAGALDVTVGAVVMKKGRAGHLLTALCKPSDRIRIQETILEQTSSIGVRWHPAERLVTQREWKEVELSPGNKVRVKIARDNQGHVVNVQPEFDDCVRYAEQHHVPVKDVLADALTRYKTNGSG